MSHGEACERARRVQMSAAVNSVGSCTTNRVAPVAGVATPVHVVPRLVGVLANIPADHIEPE